MRYCQPITEDELQTIAEVPSVSPRLRKAMLAVAFQLRHDRNHCQSRLRQLLFTVNMYFILHLFWTQTF